jgi:hypothetical protein
VAFGCWFAEEATSIVNLRDMATIISRSSALVLTGVTVAALSACHHAAPPPGAVNPDAQRLGGVVGQPLLIAPVQSIKIAPELAWTGLPRTADILAALDQSLSDTLRARVADLQWVYAAALVESARNNPTYATDPRALSIQALKSPKLEVAQRLPEPLASQLRMMLALHDGRLILIPVELRFDRTAGGAAHPVLHLVLVDPRLSDIRWHGEVTGADSQTFSNSFAAEMAARVADLFVAK